MTFVENGQLVAVTHETSQRYVATADGGQMFYRSAAELLVEPGNVDKRRSAVKVQSGEVQPVMQWHRH